MNGHNADLEHTHPSNDRAYTIHELQQRHRRRHLALQCQQLREMDRDLATSRRGIAELKRLLAEYERLHHRMRQRRAATYAFWSGATPAAIATTTALGLLIRGRTSELNAAAARLHARCPAELARMKARTLEMKATTSPSDVFAGRTGCAVPVALLPVRGDPDCTQRLVVTGGFDKPNGLGKFRYRIHNRDLRGRFIPDAGPEEEIKYKDIAARGGRLIGLYKGLDEAQVPTQLLVLQSH